LDSRIQISGDAAQGASARLRILVVSHHQTEPAAPYAPSLQFFHGLIQAHVRYAFSASLHRVQELNHEDSWLSDLKQITNFIDHPANLSRIGMNDGLSNSAKAKSLQDKPMPNRRTDWTPL